jgi:hypothetical protein
MSSSTTAIRLISKRSMSYLEIGRITRILKKAERQSWSTILHDAPTTLDRLLGLTVQNMG